MAYHSVFLSFYRNKPGDQINSITIENRKENALNNPQHLGDWLHHLKDVSHFSGFTRKAQSRGILVKRQAAVLMTKWNEAYLSKAGALASRPLLSLR